MIVVSHDKPGRNFVPYEFAVVGDKPYELDMDPLLDSLEYTEQLHGKMKTKPDF